jgi:hypothetical protein
MCQFHLQRLEVAFEDGTDTWFRNVGTAHIDAGEIPKRTATILKSRRKLEINNCNFSKHEQCAPWWWWCDCTETCRICFNVNFKIVFKTIYLCISWWKKTMIISRCTVCMWKFITVSYAVKKSMSNHEISASQPASQLASQSFVFLCAVSSVFVGTQTLGLSLSFLSRRLIYRTIIGFEVWSSSVVEILLRRQQTFTFSFLLPACET